MNMLDVDRQLAIIAEAKNKRSVSVEELAQKLGVSANTIRRDLNKLARDGILRRTHGGAVINDFAGSDLPFGQREMKHGEEKELIGAVAASLVEDGDSVILDAGTTCLCVARHLKGRKGLTVLTNSMAVATELSDTQNVVILSGGVLRGETLSLVGPPAEEFFKGVHVHKLFLATGGVSLERGLTNPNMHEVPVKKLMMRAADEIIVVADHHKFGEVALCPFADLADVSRIVTDKGLPQDMREGVEKKVSLVIADEKLTSLRSVTKI